MNFHALVRKARSLGRQKRGSVLIETAIAAPVLLLALGGMTDLTLMALARLKLSSAANNIGTIVSSGGRALDEAEMTDVLDNIDKIVSPISDFATNGKVVIAAVESTNELGGNTKVVWNRCIGGLNIATLPANQRALAGSTGSAYTLASDVDLDVGLTGAVVQVSYKYKPTFLLQLIPDTGRIITKTYVQRTRFGEFTPTVINGDPNTTADDVATRPC